MEDLDMFDTIMNEELLTEMASIRGVGGEDLPILLAVNPDRNRVGDRYFKMYNSKDYNRATKVARIDFFTPRLIQHSSEKAPWMELNRRNVGNLIKMLNMKAVLNKQYYVWDLLKYYWNYEMGISVPDLDEYVEGRYDEIHKDNKRYVPASLRIPDYKQLVSKK